LRRLDQSISGKTNPYPVSDSPRSGYGPGRGRGLVRQCGKACRIDSGQLGDAARGATGAGARDHHGRRPCCGGDVSIVKVFLGRSRAECPALLWDGKAPRIPIIAYAIATVPIGLRNFVLELMLDLALGYSEPQ